MTTVDTMPVSRPLTVDDLDAIRDATDDGHRYELLDGVLVVTPAPAWRHQEAALSLAMILAQECPGELRVVMAPFDWRPSHHTTLQPDILVARYADLVAVPDSKFLVQAPILAVEVLSPSTKRFDRLLKFGAYAEEGVTSYWIVDPNPGRPSVEVYASEGPGRYGLVGSATGEERLAVTAPFPAQFTPAALVARLHPH